MRTNEGNQKQKLFASMEDLFNMAYRRDIFVAEKVAEGNPVPIQDMELSEFHRLYVGHKYFGKKLTKDQISQLKESGTSMLGVLGKFASWGQCLGGSIGSIDFGGFQVPEAFAAQQAYYMGLPQRVIEEQAKHSYEGKCPVCNKIQTIYEMVNGDVVCAAGHLKLCGNESHNSNQSHKSSNPSFKSSSPHNSHTATNKLKTASHTTTEQNSYGARIVRQIAVHDPASALLVGFLL
jgi:hypothetical protein